tara:strand:+ start:82 stop:429 length:348 start_codon:yes stop_codon:yes gene_type:complete
MKTGELRRGTFGPGDPRYDQLNQITTAAISTYITLSGQHPMSAACALLIDLFSTLECADNEAAFDLAQHIHGLKDRDMTNESEVSAVAEERYEILGRLVSAYERQTAEMEGGGRA